MRSMKYIRTICTIRSELSPRIYNLIFLLSILTLIGLYSAFVYTSDKSILPTWGKLWIGMKTLVYDPVWEQSFLWDDSIASLGRLLPAVALASLIGVILGMYMGMYVAVEAWFARPLVFMTNIPPNAIMVAFMITFGFGAKLFLSVIIFGIAPAIARSVFEAVKAVSSEHIFGAKTLGASPTEIVWSITFFQVLPMILETIRQSIAPALIYLIATEWVTGNDGFGHRFMMLQRTARMELIFPYVMYLGIMGMITMWLFRQLEKWLCPWYTKE